jgi:hypothetical protein
MMKMLFGLSFLLAFLCASCTAPQALKAQSKLAMADIDGLVIINNTESDITEVKLIIAESTRQVNVNRVLPMSEFTTAFQAKEYRGHPAQLSWRQNGATLVSRGITFYIPREVYKDKVLTAFLTISSDGQIRAEAK